ncbi:MAG: CocE/NonD family hydrolase [Bryobacteraceae bacterium]
MTPPYLLRFLLSFVLGAAALWAQPSPAPGRPASLKGPGDDVTFYLYVNEDRVGTLKTKWMPGGAYQNEATVAMAGQSMTVTTTIAVDAEGFWTQMTSAAPAGTASCVREGATARRTIKDKTTTFDVKPGARLFDNYGPALMSQSVRLYDRAKGGKQPFPLILVPGAALDGALEFKDQVERTVAGKDLTLLRYIFTLTGPGVAIDLTLWADREGLLYLAEVPSQHAAYVRDGYESLRKEPVSDPLISQPKFEVTVQAAASVPMRDGVKLATDLYLPQTDSKVPVILIRTPYKKEMDEIQGRYYARRGYAVAIQDCRGRFGSAGVWEPFLNEAKDGYDAIEWLAAQPWSNGKAGMIGGSYVGWVQWWAASQHPPHLVTIIPNVAPPDPFYNIPYEHGAFFILGAIWWADILESKATGDLSGVALSKIGGKKYGQLLRALPVIDLDKAVLGKENPYWRQWIQHPVDDEWWAPADFLDKLKDVNIPAFHQSGWFDGDGIGTKLNYLQMKEYGHAHQKLTIGPWGHTDTAARKLGEHDFGPQAIIDLQRDYLRWFDYWLKGIDNGITKEPLVSIFVMGSNQWLHGDTYPLPATKFTKLYFSGDGKANTSKGDGRLTFEEPATGAHPDKYLYDPGNPTPTPDFYETTEEQDKQVRSQDEKEKEAEGHHQKVTAERQDILVYQTEELREPLTFAGPVSATLYASSSAPDTDWFVSLVEIEKDGKTFSLAAGKLRARFRNSVHKPAPLKPGQIYEYKLDLWHTGITVPAGHRLRVEVASAYFPMFSRNLNTGGHNETETKFVPAHQVVYHDRQHPSHVLLPVIPAEELKK